MLKKNQMCISHVPHIQASALVPGGKDRQSQELAEEFINIRESNK